MWCFAHATGGRRRRPATTTSDSAKEDDDDTKMGEDDAGGDGGGASGEEPEVQVALDGDNDAAPDVHSAKMSDAEEATVDDTADDGAAMAAPDTTDADASQTDTHPPIYRARALTLLGSLEPEKLDAKRVALERALNEEEKAKEGASRRFREDFVAEEKGVGDAPSKFRCRLYDPVSGKNKLFKEVKFVAKHLESRQQHVLSRMQLHAIKPILKQRFEADTSRPLLRNTERLPHKVG